MEPWKNTQLSLGERCIAFCENEMHNGVKEDLPNSFTSPRIREYLAICNRTVNGKDLYLGLTSGNWCAAGQSFALHESLLPSESAPHGYRVGVVEIVSDLIKNGLYRSSALVRSKAYQIKRGDIIIFDRSNPSNPASAWWRHIGRVSEVNGDSFKCLSGNNGGQWRISDHTINQSNLLGFGEYPTASTTIMQNPDFSPDWSNVDILDLSPPHDTGDNLALDNHSFFDIFEGTK